MPPEAGLRDRIQLLDQRLYITPFWPQRLSVAATRIGGKAINAGDDFLHTGVLQIRDELVKLMDILFGEKEVAPGLHSLHLAGEFDRTQALVVGSLVHHSPIMDLFSTKKRKPEHNRVKFAQGFQNLAPVQSGRYRKPGRRKRLKIV